jgi:hypothetical protein
MRNHWIGVVSRSHVLIGVKGGFVQLEHGKQAPLRRMHAGDMLAMYSPRESYPEGAALRAFTAIGVVRTGEVYQVKMSADFEPYRVDIEFFPCVDAPVAPLIERLSFIRSKKHWGAAFRFGYLKVPESDFALIADAMRPGRDATRPPG